jgi:DNA-binding transcriptional MerR regulator
MFSIGEFARLGSVSVRSLRHYHDLGLLAPAEVDETTGYRRYSAGQLPVLNRIVALKELGFSLEQVRELTGEVTVAELRGMLTLRRAQLEAEVGQQHARLAQIETRLREIEREDDMPEYDIVVKELPAQRVAVLANPAPGFGAANLGPILGPAIERLYAILAANQVAVVGNAFVFYEGDPDQGSLVAYAALPIADSTPPLPSPVAIVELPHVQEAVSVVLAAPTETTHSEVYPVLGRWVEDHGYEVVGHGRDVFLNTAPPRNADDLVMEIQWPLLRAEGQE